MFAMLYVDWRRILFYFQMQNKVNSIELGGKALSPNKYLQKQYPPTAKGLVSTHRIAGKISPSKYRPYNNQTSRQQSHLASQNSFVQLKDSSVSGSYRNSVKLQSPLRDASNLAMISPRQLVRVSFVNNSPNVSRASSIHARETLQSPGKMSAVEPDREALERRLKVLQGRIGELHREKHEMAGKLNEENRRVYHQNTALKLRLSEMTKRMEKKQQFTVAEVDRRAEAEVQALGERQSLRGEIVKLSKQLEEERERSQCFENECAKLNSELGDSKQKCKALWEQNKVLASSLKQGEEKYDSLHGEYLQLEQQKLQLASMKEQFESQLQQIQASSAETAHTHTLIVQQYEAKMEQYRVAYDKNQEVIEQLTQQLQMMYVQQQQQQYVQQQQQQQPYPQEDEIINKESQGELVLQCKNLENNFLQALQERDQQLTALMSKNRELMEQLSAKDQYVAQLNAQIQQQAVRLQEVAGALERYTAKMQQMQEKYEKLRQQHDQQLQKTKLSPQEKCKKCEELTKIIFRLNSHLNKRN